MEKIKDLQALLRGNVLFAGVDASLIADMLTSRSASIVHFAAGECILHQDDEARRLGVLVRGTAEVYKAAGSMRVLMSVLERGSIIGAATLFLPGARSVTEIYAKKAASVLFIPEDTLKALMRKDFRIAENYMAYLTERIHFLTGRIESIACPSVADKLLNYLAQAAEDGKVKLPGSMNDLADALSISRASLYRVMDDLSWAGKIKRDGKIIYLIEV